MGDFSGVEVSAMSIGMLEIFVVLRHVRDEFLVIRDVFSGSSHDCLRLHEVRMSGEDDPMDVETTDLPSTCTGYLESTG